MKSKKQYICTIELKFILHIQMQVNDIWDCIIMHRMCENLSWNGFQIQIWGNKKGNKYYDFLFIVP